MVLKVYNTLSRKKEELKPLKEKKINMFVCGPTVYNYIHIGNAKTFTQFDMIARYIRYKGFDLYYIMNITDIDDKIIKAAKETGVSESEHALKFEEEFHKDMDSLGNKAANNYPRATAHMNAIIKQVKELIDKGFAYETTDGVYFEIDKFPEYGKLSKQPLEQIKEGARVEVNEDKKNPVDFVLWKKHREGEPFWDSPWGKGRPGWHIEDTAITETFFGPQYDLHGGAMDLIFPHHECEIAQMEAASGKKPLVKYWLHTAFLNMKKEKMSKSLGNFFTLREVLKKHDAMSLKYFFLSNHYRTPVEFSFESLAAAKNALGRINNFVHGLLTNVNSKGHGNIQDYCKDLLANFEDAMDDDFDTPKALSHVFDFIREVNKLSISAQEAEEIVRVFKKIDGVFGFISFKVAEVPEEITMLAEKRLAARKDKDWKESDRLRDVIRGKGFEVSDTPDGKYVLKKKK